MSGKSIETCYICSEHSPRSFCYNIQIGYSTVFCCTIECSTIVNSYLYASSHYKLSHSKMSKRRLIIIVTVIDVVHPLTILMSLLLKEFVNTIVLFVFKVLEKTLII